MAVMNTKAQITVRRGTPEQAFADQSAQIILT